MMEFGSAASGDARRFRFRRCIGVGGFGEVYLAEMLSAGGVTSNVAVKLLISGVDPRSSPIERLRDEGKLLGLLDHPVILRVTDLVVLEGRAGLVTQYIDGCDLDACFTGSDMMPEGALFEVIGHVADALHHAFHTRGPDGRPLELVHRDIKPSNIRMGRHGEVKLLDFGIARANTPERETQTQIGLLVGTRSYMSPERFDESTANPPSDVYALGCIAYEGIAHRRLFKGLNLKEHIALAMNEPAFKEYVDRHLDALRTDAEVVGLIRAMLAFEPEARPTAAEVQARCEEIARKRTPTLKAWLRAWTWPSKPDRQSDLVGKTLVEGSSVSRRPASDSLPGAAPASGSVSETIASSAPITASRPVTVAAGVMGVTGLLALAVAVALVAGVGLVWWNGQGEPTPVAAVPAAAAPEPPVAAAPAPVAEAVPVEAPAPVAAPAQVAAPAVVTAAAPKTPTPAPPAPAPAGRTEIRGTDLPVELRGAGGTHAPGPVSPGSYEIWADFGSGLSKVGSVTVAEGQAMQLRCSRMKQTCSGVSP